MTRYLEEYRALIDSDRVGRETRDALSTRARPDSSRYEPLVISAAQLDILRAVLARVIPQTGPVRIDLAARLDGNLSAGTGDGWRRDELPADAVAYRAGLETLADAARVLYAEEFIRLDPGRQDALLHRMLAGELGSTGQAALVPERLDARQMQAWFDDLRADAVRVFVAHPQTLAALGYSGIANGGDGSPKTGFVQLGVDEREPWEPVAPGNVKL